MVKNMCMNINAISTSSSTQTGTAVTIIELWTVGKNTVSMSRNLNKKLSLSKGYVMVSSTSFFLVKAELKLSISIPSRLCSYISKTKEKISNDSNKRKQSMIIYFWQHTSLTWKSRPKFFQVAVRFHPGPWNAHALQLLT